MPIHFQKQQVRVEAISMGPYLLAGVHAYTFSKTTGES